MAFEGPIFSADGMPDVDLLSDLDRLVAVMGSVERFEASAGVSHCSREIDSNGVVSFADIDIQFAWEVWRAGISDCAKMIVDLHKQMAKAQAELVEESAAFAANLRGSKQTTGATYAHLLRQRDGLASELAQERAKRLGGAPLA